jgi:hypothetical protein
MVRVRFTERRVTQEAEPQTFDAGEEYDLPPASAERWVRRSVAVIVGADGAAPSDDGDSNGGSPVTDKPKPARKPRAKKQADAGTGDA